MLAAKRGHNPVPACFHRLPTTTLPETAAGENMKPAPSTLKHETILKQLRHERNAEDQRLHKLQMKVAEKLGKASEMRAA
jgi:hypothetical protein